MLFMTVPLVADPRRGEYAISLTGLLVLVPLLPYGVAARDVVVRSPTIVLSRGSTLQSANATT